MNLFFKKGTTLELSTYVGPEGSIALNTETGEIHLQDGVTPGGHARAKPEALNDSPEGLYLREGDSWISIDDVVWDSGNIEIYYTLDVSASEGGSIEPSGILQYRLNETPSFTITPNEGYEIDTVLGCGGNLLDTTYTVNPITGDCSIYASFVSSYNPIGIFYGGSDPLNTVTRINSSGTLVGSETNVGTARYSLAGAGVSGIGVYYGGKSSINLNKATRIDSNGAQIGSEVNIGTARSGLAGASVGDYGCYYGGSTTSALTTITRISVTATLVGSETSTGTARWALAGANVDAIGIYYGGSNTSWTTYYNRVTRIDATGNPVGSETSVGTARNLLAGASIDGCGMFYGGYNNTNLGNVSRINVNGALLSSETALTDKRMEIAGAGINNYGVYYSYSRTTIIDSNSTFVGTQSSVGTSRNLLAGAGI